MRQSLTNNKRTKKFHFPGKMPIRKHQQIDYFLLINNVPDFEKMSIPLLNNNNNLFLHSTFFLNCQSLLTNLIVLARVAFEQRYKLALFLGLDITPPSFVLGHRNQLTAKACEKALQELGKVYIVTFAKNSRSQVTQARVQTIHTMRLL